MGGSSTSAPASRTSTQHGPACAPTPSHFFPGRTWPRATRSPWKTRWSWWRFRLSPRLRGAASRGSVLRALAVEDAQVGAARGQDGVDLVQGGDLAESDGHHAGLVAHPVGVWHPIHPAVLGM